MSLISLIQLPKVKCLKPFSMFSIFSPFQIKSNTFFILIFLFLIHELALAQPNARDILQRMDNNMAASSRIFESEMTIHSKRHSQTIRSKTYSIGSQQAFTEYLSPAREAGTKMLKLENQLWIYTPSSDRIIQLSGHMLRQSVMGSDLSYEDMMNDTKMSEAYNPEFLHLDSIDGRSCYCLKLTAIRDDLAYASRQIWVDTEFLVPLKEELYAKSGQLLKQSSMSDIRNIDGRWFPAHVVYKDMLKEGRGTEFHILDIQFDKAIPEHYFSKAILR